MAITINQGDTLSGIAQAQGTTVDALLAANPNISNPNLIQAGGSLNLPETGNVPAENIGTQQDINLPQPEQPQLPQTPVNQGQVGVDALLAEQAQNTPTQDTQDVLLQRYFELAPQMAGKTAFGQQVEDQLGVSANKKALAELSGLIGTRGAEFDQMIKGVEGQGRGLTTGIVGSKQNKLIREKGSEIGVLNARALALQGNITAAQTEAQRAVDLKYAPIEEEIQTLQLQLEAIQPILSREEKRQADIQAKKWDLQMSELEEAKQKEASAYNLLLDVAQSGLANPSMLQNAFRLAEKGDLSTADIFKQFGSVFAPKADTGAPTIKSINGVDMQWNPATQQWQEIGPGEADQVKSQQALDQLGFLRDSVVSAEGLAGGAGTSFLRQGIGRFFKGATKKDQLESYTNTLRTNVLTLMTDPSIKKFFGPQMSEADVRLMTAAGTTLNPDLQTPKQLKVELKRLDDLLNRMETSVKNGTTGGNTITAPNGEQVIIID